LQNRITPPGPDRLHITADETDLKESSSCVVANDRLRFGTRIIIEGIGTCEVHDRIGKRARANRFDIFMNANLICAKDFGRRRLKFTIARG
jgi:3D (Asp-Asp-Asp) domain-containing protein